MSFNPKKSFFRFRRVLRQTWGLERLIWRLCRLALANVILFITLVRSGGHYAVFLNYECSITCKVYCDLSLSFFSTKSERSKKWFLSINLQFLTFQSLAKCKEEFWKKEIKIRGRAVYTLRGVLFYDLIFRKRRILTGSWVLWKKLGKRYLLS